MNALDPGRFRPFRERAIRFVVAGLVGLLVAWAVSRLFPLMPPARRTTLLEAIRWSASALGFVLGAVAVVRTDDVRVRVRVLTVFFLVSWVVLLGSGIAPYPFEGRRGVDLDVVVRATGRPAPGGKGAEVWLFGIEMPGGESVPPASLDLDPGWWVRPGAMVAATGYPLEARWRGRVQGPIHLIVASHPWSGEVEVRTSDGWSHRQLLYRDGRAEVERIEVPVRRPPFVRRIRATAALALAATLVFLSLAAFDRRRRSTAYEFFRFGFLVTVASGVVFAWTHARFFDGLAYDGALQFFNPLARLARGDLPGRDYVSFHGVGQAFFFFLPFQIGGATFAASEFVRQASTMGFFLASGYAFLRALGIRRAVAVVGAALPMGFETFEQLAFPHETSLGLRTSVPLLLACLVNRAVRGVPRTRALAFGLLAGACLFWSTEQGPVCVVGTALWLVVEREAGAGIRRIVADVFVVVLVGVGTYLGLVTLVSGGHPGEVLRYAFVDIPSDQRWYFGAPPNPFLSTFRGFFEPPVRTSLVCVTIASGLALAAFASPRARRIEGLGLAMFAVSSTALAGLLMQTGYTSDFYNAPAIRVLLLVGFAAAIRSLPASVLDTAEIAVPHFGLAAILLYQIEAISFRSHTQTFAERPFYPEIGAAMGRNYDGFDEVLSEIRRTSGPISIHSDYRGFFEQILHTSPTTRYDYVIHALGRDRRREYLRDFAGPERPRFVQTLSRCHSIYARWLQQETWPYYRSILEHYEPIGTTTASVVWRESERRDASAPIASARLDAPGRHIRLSRLLRREVLVERKYFEITVRYRVPRERFSSLTRHLVAIEPDEESMAVALPPYETEFSFPIDVRTGEESLAVDSIGLFRNQRVAIDSVAIRSLAMPRERLDAMFTCAGDGRTGLLPSP